MLAKQLDGTHRIGREADRKHQPLGACRLGGARLDEAIIRIAADRQPPRQVIEQPELLHQLDVGFAGARAATPRVPTANRKRLTAAANQLILAPDE